MPNFAYVHIQSCVWGALLIVVESKGSKCINNSDRDVPSGHADHYLLAIAIINAWATPFSSATLAFDGHEQKHFIHKNRVCERKRCCASTFVMIMLQRVRWPFNSLHWGIMYKLHLHASSSQLLSLCTQAPTTTMLRWGVFATSNTHTPHSSSYLPSFFHDTHTQAPTPTMLWWDGAPLGLRFIQTPRRLFPFSHSTYHKTMIGLCCVIGFKQRCVRELVTSPSYL